MNSWLILQLVLDILFFIAVAVLFVRGMRRNRPPEKELPDVEEIKEQVARFEVSMRKGEEMLRRIEGELKDASNAIAMQDLLQRQKATAAMKKDRETERSLEKLEDILIDKPKVSMKNLHERKKYVKALHAQGLPTDEIGKRLSISVSEVELTLAMIKKEEAK